MHGEEVDLKQYEREISRILDQYVTASQAEVLTDQIEVTNREELDAAIEELGSVASKAEAIAAQTKRRITERKQDDEVLYGKFSERIAEILQAMHEKKMADIEALKQLREIEKEVDQRKDDETPDVVQSHPGAGVLYRNLRELLPAETEEQYQQIILELANVVQRSATVDWWRNYEIKRQMRSNVDDYVYDEIKLAQDIEVENEQIEQIVEKVMALAENNHSDYGV